MNAMWTRFQSSATSASDAPWLGNWEANIIER